MSLLEKLLEETKLPNQEFVEQLRQICDKIQNEEELKYKEVAPLGPSIFLCVNVNGRRANETGFLTLEREDVDMFIICYYTILISQIEQKKNPKRVKVWQLNENKAKRILDIFLQKVKAFRGDKIE